MNRTILATTAAAAVLLGGAGPAAGAVRPRTDLTLVYMAEAGYATAVTLRCNPPGGAHPKPAAACRTLRAVGGRPERIKLAHTMCTMIYAPITAQITGRWRGKRISWTTTYGNTCEMTRATGVLFRF